MKAIIATAVLAAFIVIASPSSAGACTDHGLGYRPESWYIGSGTTLPVVYPQTIKTPLSQGIPWSMRPKAIKRWKPTLRAGGGIALRGMR